MILRSNEVALTLTLSHRNGRGNFSIKDLYSYPRPLCGRGKGEGSVFARTLISEHDTKFRIENLLILRGFRVLRGLRIIRLSIT